MVVCIVACASASANTRLEQFYGQWQREVGHRLEWAVRSQEYVLQNRNQFTLEWLGNIIQVHQTLARQFLMGTAPMSLDQGQRAGDAFGVHPGWILAFDMIRTRFPVDVYGMPLSTYRNFKPIVERALQISAAELQVIQSSPCSLLLQNMNEDDLVQALRDRGWSLSVRPGRQRPKTE